MSKRAETEEPANAATSALVRRCWSEASGDMEKMIRIFSESVARFEPQTIAVLCPGGVRELEVYVRQWLTSERLGAILAQARATH